MLATTLALALAAAPAPTTPPEQRIMLSSLFALRSNPIGVEDQLPKERAVLRNDPDVGVGDEQPNLPAGVRAAQTDMAQAAQVADGDVAGLADPVLADAEVGAGPVDHRPGLDAALEDGPGCRPTQGPVGPLRVVVRPEGIELELEDDQ